MMEKYFPKQSKLLFLALISIGLLMTDEARDFTAASANSAQRYFYGTYSSGALALDEDSPIIVTNEELVFDIPSGPQLYIEDANQYDSSVSATYTFSNPSDYEVTSGLAFPVTTYVDYFQDDIFNDVIDNYDVLVNDEPVTTTLRHTYRSGAFNDFNVDVDLGRLRDTKQNHQYFNDDLLIYHHRYVMSADRNATSYKLEVVIDSSFEGIVLSNNYYYFNKNLSSTTIAFSVGQGIPFDIYLIGENIDLFALEYNVSDRLNPSVEVTGIVNQISTTTLDFTSFVMTHFSGESPINEIDKYNIIVDFYAAQYSADYVRVGPHITHDFEQRVLTWYTYEITIPPGQEITNKVIAPLFPNIDSGYDPAIYDYVYLLSPAKTWTSFGSLNVKINTPLYLIECNFDNVTEIETGYQLSFDSLPDQELSFKLSISSEPNPISYVGTQLYIFMLFFVIAGFAFIVVPLVVVIVTIVMVRRKNKPPVS
jgi:hypothetical protein